MKAADLFLEAHPVCSAWCKPAEGLHALVGWHNRRAFGDVDPRPAAQAMMTLHFGKGTVIEDMRPAPEAEVPADWRNREQIDDKGLRRPALATADEVAYLTVIRLSPTVLAAVLRELAGRV